MAISTNGAIITRVTSALYGEYLSNASYTEVSTTAPATLAASFLSNDFAGKTDLQIATTMLTNLGLTSITGLDNWLSAQLTAAGSTTAAKGAKIVSILNDYANLTADATYGTYATSFNAKVAAGLVKSQTTGAAGGSYATADAVTAVDNSFALTIANNTFTGGTGNDTFNGALGGSAGTSITYSSSDSLDGGAGSDTLYVENTATGGTLSFANVKNMETIQLVNTGATTSVSLANDAAYTNLTSLNSTQNVTFASVKNAATAVTASNLGAAVDLTVDYFSTTLVAGTADNLVLNVDAVGIATNPMAFEVTGGTAANVLEKLTINASGSASYVSVDLNEANTATLAINASAALALTMDGDTDGSANTLKTIDASGSTAAVTLTVFNNKTTVTGGAGNDSITGGSSNDTINAGAGNDSITGGAGGNDSVDAGTGNDTVSVDGANIDENDVLVGGDGTDTLKLTGAIAYTTTNTDDATGVSGFEKINIAGDITQRMSGLTSKNSITAVTMATSGADGVLTYVSGINAVTYSEDSTLSVSLAADGTADAMAITLAGGSTTSPSDVQVTFTDADGYIDTVSVASNGSDDAAANELILDAAGATSLTVTGTQDLTVTGTDVTALATVDASGWSATTLIMDLSTSDAAITYTPGTGVQKLSLGSGADIVTTGSSSDSILGGDGADSIVSAAGNDTVYGNDGKDTIDAGTGNDSIYGGAGDDKITAGDGNDSIDAGAGSDSVLGGEGNDTITAGAGSDTLEGGAGNDTYNLETYLSSGDSITDSSGTGDKVVVTTLASGTAAPTMSGVETLAITSTGGNATLDFTDVTGLTTLTVTTMGEDDDLTITEAPSTLTAIKIGGANTQPTDYSFTFDSSPSALTVSFDSQDDSETLTLVDAETVTLTNLTTANAAGTTRAYATTNDVILGAITADDTRSLTIQTTALTAATDVNGASADVTVAAVSANSLESLTLKANGYGSLITGTVTTTSSSVASVTLTAADYATLAVGAGATVTQASTAEAVSASSASSVDAIAITVGTAANLYGGNITVGSATVDSLNITVGVAGLLDLRDTNTAAAAITADTITALTLDFGAASTIDLDVNSASVNIAASVGDATITYGANVAEDLSFGHSSATFGDFVLSGNSIATTASTFIFDGATMDSFTASSFGGKLIFNGSGMTGDIDSVVGSNQADSIVGGAGADVISAGAGNDTIIGGAGVDSLTVGAGTDTVRLGGDDTGGFTSPTANTISTATFDVISGLAAGDVLNFSDYTATSADAITAGALQSDSEATATTVASLTLLDNSTIAIRGTYTASTNTFVGATDGTATLFVYDSAEATTTVTPVAVVLVGTGALAFSYANTNTAGVITIS